jgi:hypothetical protein
VTQLMPVPFGAVNEGGDPKSLPAGTMLCADNCAMDKARRLGKRRGTLGLVKTLLDGGTVAAGVRLPSRGDEIAIADGTSTHVYSVDVAAWQTIARPPPHRVTRRRLVDPTRSAGVVDIAITGNLLVTAYLSGYTGPSVGAHCYVQIENLATGAKVFLPRLLGSTRSSPRVLINGTTAYILTSDAAGPATVWCATINLTTMAFVAQTALVTDALATTPLDAAISTPTPTGVPTLFLAYNLNAGAARLCVISFTLSTLAGITSQTTTMATGYEFNSVSLCANANHVAVVYSEGFANVTRVIVLDTALTVVTANTTITGGFTFGVFIDFDTAGSLLIGRIGGGGAAVVSAAFKLITSTWVLATLVEDVLTIRTTFSVCGTSRPWRTNGRWFALVTVGPKPYSDVSSQPIPNASSVIVEIEFTNSKTGFDGSTHAWMATAENQTGWNATARGYLTQAASDAAGNVYVAAAYRNREPLGFASIPVGWNLYKIGSGGDTHRPAVIGAGALAAAGAPYWYDGASATPFGFAHAPMILTATATAGGSMVVGVYQYVAVYEWRDANGVLHRSIPSPPFTGTTAGANLSLSIRVATSSLAHRQSPVLPATSSNPVLIALYRTTVGGSIFYRLTYEPGFGVRINDPYSQEVTYLDTAPDANVTNSVSAGGVTALASQPQLYTAGELADVMPPSLLTVAAHRGRVVGIDCTSRMLWFTKDQTQDPGVAPGFNEVLTLAFATDKTALASLDDKLVVFGATSIDLVFGDGPDSAGAGGWQTQRLQTDVGCVEPRSVVTSPLGVMFQSARGIELLSRELQVTWVGDAIRETLALYPTITSAVLVSDVQEVRFTCTSVNGETGIVLAYDYSSNLWMRRSYNDAGGTLAASVVFVDAALIGGVYTMLTAGGKVYQETEAHHLDNGTAWVTRDVQMADLSPSGSGLGWHRVKDVTTLGTSVSPHVFEVSYARDYATAWERDVSFAEGVPGITSPGPLQRTRVTFVIQKVQAIRVRLRDLPPAVANYGTGAGPIWEGLAFRVQTKDGPAKTAKGERK